MPNTVTVRLFARLAELAGVRQTTVDLGEGLTAGDVYAVLSRQHPGIAGFADSVMFARNQEYVPAETPLAPGDELALIPPVSGGGELFEVTPEPLDPQRVVEAVRRNDAGAVALFYGIVREQNLGRRVLYLEYDAYPEMAVKVMREIAAEVRARVAGQRDRRPAPHRPAGDRRDVAARRRLVTAPGRGVRGLPRLRRPAEGARPDLEEGGVRRRRGVDRGLTRLRTELKLCSA